MSYITVRRGRTFYLPVEFGFDVSQDTFTSDIREDENSTSTLIAQWVVSFVTDGTDGEVMFKLPSTATTNVTQRKGFMDIKRMSGGEPLDVLEEPLEVYFDDPVTP